MDLFDEDNTLRDGFKKELGEWSDTLYNITLERLDSVLEKVKEERAKYTVYPPEDEMLRIYRKIAPKDVKVVIVGQDPYYNGNANGIAFACKLQPSPSLISVVKAMMKDVGTLEKQYDMQLQHLLKQGVFLLNTVLTVRKDEPNSHKSLGWQEFTKATIGLLSDKHNRIVFMLWGSEAISNFKGFINEEKHLVLTGEHPVNAARNKKDWKCNHFSVANEYLRQHGKEPIKWI